MVDNKLKEIAAKSFSYYNSNNEINIKNICFLENIKVY